jgi:phosphoribosylanthranilate isomerase
VNTKIKICGIKTKEEVNIINCYPVDYIGFIFAESKRQISIEKAVQLRGLVRNDIKVVGVFVNQNEVFIKQAIDAANLQVIQLHGDLLLDQQLAEKARQWKKDETCSLEEIWKSISVKNSESLNDMAKIQETVDRILLDAYAKGATGGTGQTFQWDLLETIPNKHDIILAGGLNAQNVAKAMQTVNPYMVDLNSGLETDLIKDEEKIKQAFKAMNNIKRL